jgi:hypothetical protein
MTGQQLATEHQRLRRAVQQVSEAHWKRRGFSGYDSYDEDYSWLTSQIDGAFARLAQSPSARESQAQGSVSLSPEGEAKDSDVTAYPSPQGQDQERADHED